MYEQVLWIIRFPKIYISGIRQGVLICSRLAEKVRKMLAQASTFIP
jgi:hypothetical protein